MARTFSRWPALGSQTMARRTKTVCGENGGKGSEVNTRPTTAVDVRSIHENFPDLDHGSLPTVIDHCTPTSSTAAPDHTSSRHAFIADLLSLYPLQDGMPITVDA